MSGDQGCALPLGFTRWGSVDFAKQLVERADKGIDVLDVLIGDAREQAGLTEGDSYYLRLVVIALPPISS